MAAPGDTAGRGSPAAFPSPVGAVPFVDTDGDGERLGAGVTDALLPTVAVDIADGLALAVALEVALAVAVALTVPDADAVPVPDAVGVGVAGPTRTPVVKANAVPFLPELAVPGAPTTASMPAASIAAAFPYCMLLMGTVAGRGMRTGMREKRAPHPVRLKTTPAGRGKDPGAVMSASVPSGFRATALPKPSPSPPRASCVTHTHVVSVSLRSKWSAKPASSPPRGEPTRSVRPSALRASLSP
jgi:hypothetical protein